MEKLEIQYDRWRVASIPKAIYLLLTFQKSPTIQSQREREKREVLGSDRWSWWRGSEIAHHQESSDMASRVVPVPNQPRGFRLI